MARTHHLSCVDVDNNEHAGGMFAIQERAAYGVSLLEANVECHACYLLAAADECHKLPQLPTSCQQL
jgi:hypothetical protein